MNKSLQDKAVDIKGKSYVLVSDRVLFFNENFKNGSIQTEIVRYEDKQIIIKAKVTPDTSSPDRYFTGYAQEIEGSTFINKTSALENAETSAVGRALALMGIGVIDSIASVDEINKANNRQGAQKEWVPDDLPVDPYPPDEMPWDIPEDNKPKEEKCKNCGAKMVTNPKTGKVFCSDKCWLNK